MESATKAETIGKAEQKIGRFKASPKWNRAPHSGSPAGGSEKSIAGAWTDDHRACVPQEQPPCLPSDHHLNAPIQGATGAIGVASWLQNNSTLRFPQDDYSSRLR
jgi:hypothetical protein